MGLLLRLDSVRILVTGGSGVLGRALLPLLEADGHEVRAPGHDELDLFDPEAVAEALQQADAIYHLATRIPPHELRSDPAAWLENDRLRAQASRLLVDAALAGSAEVYVQPSVTFVYPPEGAVDEETRIGEVAPHLESALAAEREALRFAEAGRRGVVLRLGRLDEPGPNGTLQIEDAARALLAALAVPSGLYNVVRDGERVSNARFKERTGWRPTM